MREQGGRLKYVVPLDGEQIMAEYTQLKGEVLGMVLLRLRKALMEGKISDGPSAKQLLDSIMRQHKQFDTFLMKHRKERKSPDFYTVKP